MAECRWEWWEVGRLGDESLQLGYLGCEGGDFFHKGRVLVVSGGWWRRAAGLVLQLLDSV